MTHVIVHTVAMASLVLGVVSIVGCDRIYGPVVYNDLEHQIEAHVSWADGKTDSLRMRAKTAYHLGEMDLTVTRVVFLRGGKEFAVLDRAALEKLVQSEKLGAAGFVLSEEGLRMVNRSELRQVRREDD